MMIGFSKHTDYYDRVPFRTVIARSEATRQSASGTKHISERSCKIGLCEGETDCQKVNCPAGRGTDCHTSLRTGSQ